LCNRILISSRMWLALNYSLRRTRVGTFRLHVRLIPSLCFHGVSIAAHYRRRNVQNPLITFFRFRENIGTSQHASISFFVKQSGNKNWPFPICSLFLFRKSDGGCPQILIETDHFGLSKQWNLVGNIANTRLVSLYEFFATHVATIAM